MERAADQTSSNALLGELKQVFGLVKGHFQGWPDRGEVWKMPPTSYDGNSPIRDDCDGFCLACRVLLRKRAIRSRLVYCEVRGMGHLVIESNGWILDNLQPSVVPNTLLTALSYRWLRISGYQPGEPWREITGLQS